MTATYSRRRAYVGLIGPKTERRVVVMLLEGGAAFDLPLRPDLAQHARAFSWGEGAGAGGRQLSLAILADYFGPGREGDALARHHSFAGVILQLDASAGFTLSQALLAQLLAEVPMSIELTRRPPALTAVHPTKGS